MKWYYQIRGGHTHVRVFMNGAKCGDLCFRNEEFEALRGSPNIVAIDESRRCRCGVILTGPAEICGECGLRKQAQ